MCQIRAAGRGHCKFFKSYSDFGHYVQILIEVSHLCPNLKKIKLKKRCDTPHIWWKLNLSFFFYLFAFQCKKIQAKIINNFESYTLCIIRTKCNRFEYCFIKINEGLTCFKTYLCSCFEWDRVIFLHSSWHGTVLDFAWNNADIWSYFCYCWADLT